MRFPFSNYSVLLMCFCLILITSSVNVQGHDISNDKKRISEVENVDPTSADAQDKESELSNEALERKKAKERKRDLVVYSCFGLALFMLLWMRNRKRSKTG